LLHPVATVDRMGYKAFPVVVSGAGRHWTVLDENYRLEPLADAFLTYLRYGRGRAESTTKAYAGALAVFLGWRETKGLDLLSGARNMHRFVAELRLTPIPVGRRSAGRPRSPQRVNGVMAAVNEFYKWAASNGHVDVSALSSLYEAPTQRWIGEPVARRAYPQPRARYRLAVVTNGRPRVATEEELAGLLRTCIHWRDRFLVIVLRYTGLRIGQALGLRHSDVHFLESSAELGCQISGPHLHVVSRTNPNRAANKSRRGYAVPVIAEVVWAYENYLAERDECRQAADSDFVFVNLFSEPRGAPMKLHAAQELFERLSKRGGLTRTVRPHMLRHSMATAVMEGGAHIDVVRELLGHSSISSTLIYSHASDQRMRDAVEAEARHRRGNREG